MTNCSALPRAYIERMQTLLGAAYANYEKVFNQSPITAIRINTTKVDVAHFLQLFDRELEPISWTTDGFYCRDDRDLALHPYYHAGLFYIQEASAMAPVATMKVATDDVVLDLCAAPGGKTMQITHIERLGIKQAFVMAENIDRLLASAIGNFDKVLVDAPCSGEGMFRKDPRLIDHWQEDSATYYAAIQGDLLKKAFALLRLDGELTYSTCTFAPLENECVIGKLLQADVNATLLAVDNDTFSDGLSCPELPILTKCARLYPHLLKGEGHFIARLKRLDGEVVKRSNTLANEPPEPLKEFMAAVLTKPLYGHFKTIGNQVYLLPNRAIDTRGLRVLRSGWLLGKIKGKRFEPAHSFALGLTIDQIKQPLRLKLTDDDVIKYLKCQSIDIDSTLTGWCVVTVDGFPLGWGKAQRGQLKNKYPAHLRLMRAGRL